MPATTAMATAANWMTVATNGEVSPGCRRALSPVGHAGDGASDQEKQRHHDADDARPCRPHEEHNDDGDAEDDRARRHRRVVDTGHDGPVIAPMATTIANTSTLTADGNESTDARREPVEVVIPHSLSTPRCACRPTSVEIRGRLLT